PRPRAPPRRPRRPAPIHGRPRGRGARGAASSGGSWRLEEGLRVAFDDTGTPHRALIEPAAEELMNPEVGAAGEGSLPGRGREGDGVHTRGAEVGEGAGHVKRTGDDGGARPRGLGRAL